MPHLWNNIILVCVLVQHYFQIYCQLSIYVMNSGRPMVHIKKRRLSCTLHLWKSDIPIHKTLLRNWLVRYIEDIKNDVRFAFNHPIPHGLMSYLRYLCLFAHSGVQHLLCCVFGLFVFVLYTLWYQFLWTVDFWLPFCGILKRLFIKQSLPLNKRHTRY